MFDFSCLNNNKTITRILPYDGVSLATQINQIRVGVVQRKHNAIGGVQFHHNDGFAQDIRRAQAVLSLGHFRKAGGKNEAVPEKNGPRRFRT